jgi:amino acid permease
VGFSTSPCNFSLLSGTVWTASAHIITAVIGSGVLSLAWSTAQLGWLFGPVTMMIFSLITYYTSCLLADCYRSGDQVVGKRSYTYMDAVAAYLGKYLFRETQINQSFIYLKFDMSA